MRIFRIATISRRLLASAALAVCALAAPLVQAQDKVTATTTWFAQAEHGGLYQALATGIFRRHGLDVTIRMGGPQVNGVQLLLAGQTDFIMNYDFAILQGVERGFPLVTVASPFQFDMQGVMTRADVPNLASLKGKTILVAGTGTTYWWPWFRQKFGYGEEQRRPFTNNLQPFFADPNIVVQAYPSSVWDAEQKGMPVKFHLLADEGYPPYSQAITTTQKTIDERPGVVARFVRATMEGWASFLKDPAPAAALIKKDNPAMTDAQISYTVEKLKEMKVITGGDAARLGIGAMTEERWKKTAEYMVESGMLKPTTDWKKAYSTRFIKDLLVMP